METRKSRTPQNMAEREALEHAREQAEEQARQDHRNARDEDNTEEPMTPIRGRNEYAGGTGNPGPSSGKPKPLDPNLAGER